MRNYNDTEMLCLPWSFASKDLKALSAEDQYEYLDPEKFLDQEYVDSYWSKSEILLSFSAIMHATSDHGVDSHLSRIPNTLDAEYRLYCITTKFGQLTALYHYYEGILYDILHQKFPFIDYWKKHEALLTSKTPTFEDYRSAYDAYLNLWEDYPQLRNVYPEFYAPHFASFKDGARNLFHRILNGPTEMEAVVKLEQLGTCIQRINNQTPDSTSFQIHKWWEMDEILSIRQSLQELANMICQTISTPSHQPSCSSLLYLTTRQNLTDIKEITHRLLENSEELGLAPVSFTKYKNGVLTGRKCVARAVFKGKTYVSFSGYADSNDNLVQRIWSLDPNDSLLPFFKKICTAANVTLAHLSPKVVSRIMRYEYGIAHGPMRNELLEEQHRLLFATPPTPKKDIPKLIQKNIETKYSCCERKILTQISLDFPASEINHHDGVIYVKFSPCNRCEGALRDWERKYLSNWDVYYLHEYKKK